MNNNWDAFDVDGGEQQPEQAVIPRKRIYQAPELTEWGSLVELTRGDLSGLTDFPLDGGSEGV